MPIFKLVGRFRSPNAYKKTAHTEVSPKRQPVLHYRCWRGDRHYLVSKHLSHLSTGKNTLWCFLSYSTSRCFKIPVPSILYEFRILFLFTSQWNKQGIYHVFLRELLAWPGVLYSLVCTNSHSIINSYGTAWQTNFATVMNEFKRLIYKTYL